MKRCHECDQPGHLRKNCPRTKCYACRKNGHIAIECPDKLQFRTNRREQNPLTPHGAAARPSPTASASYGENFHGHSCLSRVRSPSVSSASSEDSNGLAPSLEQNSDIRSDEAVARVADVVEHLLKREGEKKYYLFRNKLFAHFQYDGTGNRHFCLPSNDENLRRGDFDVIVLHPVYGYIHIEVKATGGCPESQGMQILIGSVKKALKTMEKGRQALAHLQPPKGARMNILTTLALPNIRRDFLCSALRQEPTLLDGLARCILPATECPCPMDVATRCLCSDDVPPKDEIVVDENTLPSQWWSNFKERGNRRQRMRNLDFERVVSSFLRKEEVTSFPQLVAHTAARYKPLIRLTDRQERAVRNPNKYVFVSGAPGSGKTLVLAAKCAQWLENGKKVFLIYRRGKATCHPAVEISKEFIRQRMRTPSRMENLYQRGLTAEIDIDKFMDSFIKDTERSHVRYEKETDEIKKPSPSLLEKEFASSAMCSLKPEQQEAEGGDGDDQRQNLTGGQRGHGINFVFDELTRRTNKGKRAQLIGAIKRRLPCANIWCAGPIPTHRPRGFQEESLPCSFRCPPRIQRILETVEQFCQSDGSNAMFEYVTSCTNVPSYPGAAEERHKLPCEGPEPFFLSHADHNATEITDCPECSTNLVDYLRHELGVTKDDSPYVQEHDVLIVLTGTHTENHMHALVHSELYRQLSTYCRVNIHDGAEDDSYDLQAKGVSIMHARNVGGVEKTVVVFVPCRHHQGGSRKDSQPHAGWVSDDGSQPSSAAEGRSQQALGDEAVGQRIPIAETLARCRHITTEQARALARLGHLNLHWIWYVVSRSLSHAIIFHF